MLARPIHLEEKNLYNSAVDHPLQTWEWGEFRQQTNKKLERVGFFQDGKIKHGLQVTFHPIPKLNQYSIGYCPRAFEPNEEQLAILKELGQQHNAVYIKLEPDIALPIEQRSEFKPLIEFLLDNNCQAGKPFFAENTFQLDLTRSKEELLANLKSKTRYNVNIAQKKGVKIVEDNSRQGLEIYLDILKETTKRQQFYLHTPEYFIKMWELFRDTDMIHIFHAYFDNTPIVSWIMFKWGQTVYYPYGASRDLHRDVMASNLMMWEMILWAKDQGAKIFDMWGCLGLDPKQTDPWFGFHRFKEGYGGQLMQFVGTFDLVLQQPQYKLVRLADDIRWRLLRAKSKIGL